MPPKEKIARLAINAASDERQGRRRITINADAHTAARWNQARKEFGGSCAALRALLKIWTGELT